MTEEFKELNIAGIFTLRYSKTKEGNYQQTYTPAEFEQMQGWLSRALDECIQSKIKEALAQPERDYERGFIDGMQKQMQSSVDKAVNAMPQRTWVGLTDDEVYKIAFALEGEHWKKIANAIEAKLKEKNA